MLKYDWGKCRELEALFNKLIADREGVNPEDVTVQFIQKRSKERKNMEETSRDAQ